MAKKEKKSKVDPLMQELDHSSSLAREKANLELDRVRNKEFKRNRLIVSKLTSFLHVPATGRFGFEFNHNR